jgi:LysR family glycine cleavage system transcriptional activator
MARRPLPPLHSLPGFEAAARLGSFTLAAEELHLTQGAISRQIRDLERYLGAPVFRRLTRRIELTEQGREFFQVVEASLRDIENAARELGPETASKRLVVSVLPTIANVWLLPRLHLFSELYPDVELRVVLSIEPVDFQRGEADIAIRVGRLPGRHYDRRMPRISLNMVTNWDGIEADELFPDILVPVCAPDLLASGPALEGPSDLLRHQLIHTASRKYAWPDWLAALHVKAPRQRRASPAFGHFFMAMDAARQGNGVAIVPEILLIGSKGGSLVSPLPQRVPSAGEYYLLIPEARLDDQTVRDFRSWLLSEVARTALGPNIRQARGAPELAVAS